jgi:outer membrane protein assembly factor BamE (lipoprotein component of BamABCDE complex)
MKSKTTQMSLLFLITTLLMSGCATFSGAESRKNLTQLRYGMSEAKVLALLGSPDSVVKDSYVQDRWIYEFRSEDKKGRNMFIQFRNGNLVRSGEITGRDVAAVEDTRIPGTCTHSVNPEVRQESVCIR